MMEELCYWADWSTKTTPNLRFGWDRLQTLGLYPSEANSIVSV